MPRVKLTPTSVKLWISANETYEWARNKWPCSQLSGARVFAEFNGGGLVDLAVNGGDGDVDAGEFNTICANMLRGRLPEDHPAYSVAVGQFYGA